MNLLFLSVGTRVELLNLFRKTAKELNLTVKITATDISELAPAVYFADNHYFIPRIGEEGYIDSIIDICLKEDIQLIIPTIDTELTILAENREKIESKTNTKVLISSPEVIEICRDKNKTATFLQENGFGTPHVYKEGETVNFPAFIKPYNGSASINIFKINNEKELLFFKEYIQEPIIQEFISGDEYTVDCFLDFDSNIISIVPRLRIRTRAGEISKGKICKDIDIIENVKRLLTVLKPIGQITIQCIKTEKGIQYIEINPRFGGGAPMSMMAGANSSAYLYRIFQGEKLSYDESYQDNLTFLRFDNSIILDNTMNPLNR